MESFSFRTGYRNYDKEITVRHDAPATLRDAVVQIAYATDFSPYHLRDIIYEELMIRPDQYNWSEDPNIDDEVHNLIHDCEWYRVYDIIEAIERNAKPQYYGEQTEFAKKVNLYFREHGIGWQLSAGQVIPRGDETSEWVKSEAQSSLQEKGRKTARAELQEAVRDISRRPDPDTSGAIQHSATAMECVLRDISGDANATLGKILNANPGLIPKPLDSGVEKIWGFASDKGRHIREGGSPTYEEAELIVGISNALCLYISRKLPIADQENSDDVPW